jgi:TonB family protein
MRGPAKSGKREARSSPLLTDSSEYTSCAAEFVWRELAQRFIVFPMKRIVLGAFVTLVSVAFLESTASAFNRDLEKQLNWQYADKILTLRRFYEGDHLRFTPDGKLRGGAPVGSWTLDGQIEVKEVHLKGKLLEIDGRRVEIVFDPKNLSNHSPKPLDLMTTLDNYSGKEREILQKYLLRKEVMVEIEMPSGKPGEEGANAAIHAVFVLPGETMMDVVPDFWQAYFADLEGKTYSPPSSLGTAYRAEPRVISAPRAINSPPPDYSEEARRAKYEGSAIVWLVVDTSGSPRDLQIQRPLGLGLDEEAVERLRTWTFEPGKKDGQPVPVKINVEVSFRLYER